MNLEVILTTVGVILGILVVTAACILATRNVNCSNTRYLLRLEAQFLAENDGGYIPPFDAWGTQIQYTVEDDNITVISAGPDRTFFTNDDFTIKGTK